MMMRWWEHSQKGVTDRRTDGQTDGRTENTICRAAWSQLKIKKQWEILSVCLLRPVFSFEDNISFRWGGGGGLTLWEWTMCKWTVPSLGHVMARCLLDTKQLPKPMLTFCWLDPWINFNKIWIKIQKFSMKENEIVICKIMATCFSASMHSKQLWRALTWAYGQQIIQCWKVPSSFDKT